MNLPHWASELIAWLFVAAIITAFVAVFCWI